MRSFNCPTSSFQASSRARMFSGVSRSQNSKLSFMLGGSTRHPLAVSTIFSLSAAIEGLDIAFSFLLFIFGDALSQFFWSQIGASNHIGVRALAGLAAYTLRDTTYSARTVFKRVPVRTFHFTLS